MLAHNNGMTWTPLDQLSFCMFNQLGALPANRPWKTQNKATIWNELTASPYFEKSETAGRGGARSKRTDVVSGTYRPVLRRMFGLEALYPQDTPEHKPCNEVYDIEALLRYMHGDPARRHNAFIVLDYFESLLARDGAELPGGMTADELWHKIRQARAAETYLDGLLGETLGVTLPNESGTVPGTPEVPTGRPPPKKRHGVAENRVRCPLRFRVLALG